MDVAPKPREISNDVVPKAARLWYEIGMNLISEDVLLNMDHQFGGTGDTNDQFRTVVNAWWTSTEKQNRTWECIVEALDSNGMKQHRLANELRKKLN